jgi:phosphate transport system substrate-binding protein
MRSPIPLILACAISLSPLRAVPVDPACPPYHPSGTLSAKLTTIGSDSLAEEMKLWSELLHAGQPGVTIDVQPKGSNYSAETLISGQSQFAYSGRPIPDNEIAAVTKAWGYPPMRVLVSGPDPTKQTTTHPQVVWVNEQNPLHSLTLAQADALFSRSLKRGGSKVITTWGELGLTGKWADAPIHKFALNATGGPGFYVKEALLLGGDWSSDVKDIREEKVVGEVAKDPYAVGITGLPYGLPGVRALALARDEGQPPVEPVLPNFLSRAYPLTRFNYLYVNKPPGKPLDPVIKELLHVVLSREGQEAAIKAHFLPLNPEMLVQELALIDRM